MSYNYKKFKLELTLQHMAMVSLTQHFCRQPDFTKEVSRTILHENHEEDQIDSPNFSKKSDRLAKIVIAGQLSEINLPEVIRKDLKGCIKYMIASMFRWLTIMREDMINKNDQNLEEKLTYFVKNPAWDNFGFVEGQRMLEGYVNGKKVIDFHSWEHLCEYFSEDHIKRFSKNIKYEDCKRTRSEYPIFWYHKVHGSFPNHHDEESYDEKALIKDLFDKSVSRGNLFAIKYLWNLLDDAERIKRILSPNVMRIFPNCHHADANAYMFLIAQMDDEQWKANIRSYVPADGETKFLLRWPWIVCINSWRRVFDGYQHDGDGWRFFFDRDNSEDIWKILLKNLEGLEQHVGNPRGILYNRQRQVFEDLWESCLRVQVNSRGRERDRVFVGWRVLSLEDVGLCKLVFGGESKRRKRLLRDIAEVLWFDGELDGDFWVKFMAGVLVDDDERKFFGKVYRKNSKKENANTDCVSVDIGGEHFIRFEI